METIDDKITRLAPEIIEPRLAASEARWLAGFVAQPRDRPAGRGMITTSGCAVVMALVIGVVGADPHWSVRDAAPREDARVLSPFSAQAPLAPSTLLRD